jgi:hypothetical protein
MVYLILARNAAGRPFRCYLLTDVSTGCTRVGREMSEVIYLKGLKLTWKGVPGRIGYKFNRSASSRLHHQSRPKQLIVLRTKGCPWGTVLDIFLRKGRRMRAVASVETPLPGATYIWTFGGYRFIENESTPDLKSRKYDCSKKPV